MACHIYSSKRTAFALFSVFRTLLFTTPKPTDTYIRVYVLAAGKSLRITEMYARRRQHLLSSNGEYNTLYISNIYTHIFARNLKLCVCLCVWVGNTINNYFHIIRCQIAKWNAKAKCMSKTKSRRFLFYIG